MFSGRSVLPLNEKKKGGPLVKMGGNGLGPNKGYWFLGGGDGETKGYNHLVRG